MTGWWENLTLRDIVTRLVHKYYHSVDAIIITPHETFRTGSWLV